MAIVLLSLSSVVDLFVQAYVSDISSEALRSRSDVGLHVDDGLRALRRQAISLLVSLVFLGGCRQGGSTHAWSNPCSSGLTGQGSAVDETDCILRQTQADQQSAG